MKFVNRKWQSIRKVLVALRNKEEYGMHIRFEKIPSFSGQSILDGRVQLPFNGIIIVGPTADGVASLELTPVGWMSPTEIIANEVNTLWQMIKDDIPAEKP